MKALNSFTYEEVVAALYSGLLGRKPDKAGLDGYIAALRSNDSLATIIREFMNSSECLNRNYLVRVRAADLPDLTNIFPLKYTRAEGFRNIFQASRDEDFDLMLRLINEHRYYDRLGVAPSAIDLDKRITAAVVRGLNAKSCIELGCFNGSVLSVLADQGIDVCGVEISHLAFLLAFPNVVDKLLFGDLLGINLDRAFDVLVAMDVLDLVSPLSLGAYIKRVADLVAPTGFALINSPMIGDDDVFGAVLNQYLPEWRATGDQCFWRHMDCDAKGWPIHGRLVWASPRWWEQMFLQHGLVRNRRLEEHIHILLQDFFDTHAPGRRSFFLLHHAAYQPRISQFEKTLSVQISDVLSKF